MSRALGTPDLFLIQGLPGTGKTRIVGELLRQANRAGYRVLLLAARGAAVDSILARVPDLEALRVLGRDEDSDALDPIAQQRTLAAQEQEFRRRLIAAAQNEAIRSRQRLDILHALLPILNSLPDSIRTLAAIDETIARTRHAKEDLPEEVRGRRSNSRRLPRVMFWTNCERSRKTTENHWPAWTRRKWNFRNKVPIANNGFTKHWLNANNFGRFWNSASKGTGGR